MIFLAEAFAHPELMLELSRIGFTQSYTHFPWQHAPWQLRDYYAQMLRGEEVEHFRGAAWPNTPDILTAELQEGSARRSSPGSILAATLNATYGIYGPPFELLQNTAGARRQRGVPRQREVPAACLAARRPRARWRRRSA